MRESFPKSARLRKSSEFRFRPYSRFNGEHLSFIYTSSGSGRLGISISKKVLPRAVARNRLKRLVRESFRRNINELRFIDVNVLGQKELKQAWRELGFSAIERDWACFQAHLNRSAP